MSALKSVRETNDKTTNKKSLDGSIVGIDGNKWPARLVRARTARECTAHGGVFKIRVENLPDVGGSRLLGRRDSTTRRGDFRNQS